MAYNCEECGASFRKLSLLKHHQRIENHWKKYDCNVCGKWFTRKNLSENMKKHQEQSNLQCDECGQVFSRPYTLTRHRERVHQVGSGQKRPTPGDDNDGQGDQKVEKR